MKKNIVIIVVLCIVLGGAFYFYNEYKTKNFLTDVLNIEKLDMQKDYVSIHDETKDKASSSEVEVVMVKPADKDYDKMTRLLKNMDAKRLFNSEDAITDGYQITIYHDHKPVHLMINNKGVIDSPDRKMYKVTDAKVTNELMDLMQRKINDKKSTQ